MPPAPTQEAAPSAPRQARVDAPPKPLKTIKPDYPRNARQRGEEGDVGLEISINERGRVDSVSVVSSSGYAELDAAAVHAVQKARFMPAMAGRTAVSSTAHLTITFRITGARREDHRE